MAAEVYNPIHTFVEDTAIRVDWLNENFAEYYTHKYGAMTAEQFPLDLFTSNATARNQVADDYMYEVAVSTDHNSPLSATMLYPINGVTSWQLIQSITLTSEEGTAYFLVSGTLLNAYGGRGIMLTLGVDGAISNGSITGSGDWTNDMAEGLLYDGTDSVMPSQAPFAGWRAFALHGTFKVLPGSHTYSLYARAGATSATTVVGSVEHLHMAVVVFNA